MNRYGNAARPRTQGGSAQSCRSSMAMARSCQSCRADDSMLIPLPLAMAYVPMQSWGETYTPEKALCRGTLFPALDLPFLRGGCGV